MTSDQNAHHHVAQFFVDDWSLGQRVSAFAADGLAGSDAVILFATRAHATAVEQRLSELGHDIPALRAAGRYDVIDADRALEELFAPGARTELMFGEIVGGALRRAQERAPQIRVYGELVALAWSAGERDKAIRLERLWNEIIGFHRMALLCGYAFDGHIDATGFELIASQHERVDPPPAFEEPRRSAA